MTKPMMIIPDHRPPAGPESMATDRAGAHWPLTMSADICPACRIRYLPLHGDCLCANLIDRQKDPH